MDSSILIKAENKNTNCTQLKQTNGSGIDLSSSDMERRAYILEKCRSIECAQTRLDTYHQFYNNLPQQGTVEWLSQRKIGASSIAAILRQNKRTTIESVAYDILNLEARSPPILTTQWGHIFEPAAKAYICALSDVRIYEFGSIPGFGSRTTKKIYTSCSPDGVFIVTPRFIELYKSSTRDKESSVGGDVIKPGQIALLEIKCPFRRIIDGIVPDYYLPQLYKGMRTLDICETSAFCEFGFRVCSLGELNFRRGSRTDTTQRGITNKSESSGSPHAIGVIIVCGPAVESNSPHEPDYSVIDEYSKNMSFDQSDDLLDAFDHLYNYISHHEPTTIKIEYYLLFLKYFGAQYQHKICQFLHLRYIAWDTVDFGSVNNMLYKWVPSIDSIFVEFTTNRKYELTYLPPLTEEYSDSGCVEHFNEQLREAAKKYENIVGVIPYKLLDKNISVVDKIPYNAEIAKIIKFGIFIESLRGQSDSESLRLKIGQFCSDF